MWSVSGYTTMSGFGLWRPSLRGGTGGGMAAAAAEGERELRTQKMRGQRRGCVCVPSTHRQCNQLHYGTPGQVNGTDPAY